MEAPLSPLSSRVADSRLRVNDRLPVPATEDRVPHISLVFREMWDTTACRGGIAVSFLAFVISGSTQSVQDETQYGPFDSAKSQIDYVTGPWQSPPQTRRCAS